MSLPPAHVLVERLIKEMVWIAGHWDGLADDKAAAAWTLDFERGYIAGLRWAATDLIHRAAEIKAALYPSPEYARPALRLAVDNTRSQGREPDEVPHRPDR